MGNQKKSNKAFIYVIIILISITLISLAVVYVPRLNEVLSAPIPTGYKILAPIPTGTTFSYMCGSDLCQVYGEKSCNIQTSTPRVIFRTNVFPSTNSIPIGCTGYSSSISSYKTNGAFVDIDAFGSGQLNRYVKLSTSVTSGANICSPSYSNNIIVSKNVLFISGAVFVKKADGTIGYCDNEQATAFYPYAKQSNEVQSALSIDTYTKCGQEMYI